MLQYKLTNPCHQNWDKMTLTAQGKFCAHCQKQVYDLTNQKVIINLPQSFCGRIESDKIAHEISFNKMLRKQSVFRYMAISLLLLFAKNVKAQLLNKINFIPDSIPQQNMEDTIIKNITISGTLIDEKTKDSIPFAKLIVTDSLSNQLGVGTTYYDGTYNFMIPKARIKGKSISIMTYSEGYDTIIVNNVPIVSLRNDIYIGRNILGIQVAGGMGSTSYYIDGVAATKEEVLSLKDPEPFYLHEENPEVKRNRNVFVSEFDYTTPKRETIVKNNQR